MVLGNAGAIVTAICDDGVDRVRFLALLQNKWRMCLFWGVLYYSWMAVVAWKTDLWKEERLGEEFSFKDAYWFRCVAVGLLFIQKGATGVSWLKLTHSFIVLAAVLLPPRLWD